MNTLITGGTGFVGSALTQRLLESGHEVTILSSRMHRGVLNDDKLHYVIADTSKPGDWQNLVDGMNVVVNLAGRSVFHLWTEKYKKQIWESRILTTRNLVDAMGKDEDSVLLSCSAAGYYGDGGEEDKDENSVCGQGFLADVCNEWEHEALKAEEKGIRVSIMRFGVVLGASGGAIATMEIPFKLALGGPIGNGRQWFPWIHIDDLIEAAIFLVRNDTCSGCFNFTAPELVRQKDFAANLGKVLRRPAILPTPGFIMKSVLGEFGHSLLQGQKVYPKALLDKGFVFTYPELNHALREIFSG